MWKKDQAYFVWLARAKLEEIEAIQKATDLNLMKVRSFKHGQVFQNRMGHQWIVTKECTESFSSSKSGARLSGISDNVQCLALE